MSKATVEALEKAIKDHVDAVDSEREDESSIVLQWSLVAHVMLPELELKTNGHNVTAYWIAFSENLPPHEVKGLFREGIDHFNAMQIIGGLT